MKLVIIAMILVTVSFAETARIQPGTLATSTVLAAADRANYIGRLQLANKPSNFLGNFNPVLRRADGSVEGPLTALTCTFISLQAADYASTKINNALGGWENAPPMAFFQRYEPTGYVVKAGITMAVIAYARGLHTRGRKKSAYGFLIGGVVLQSLVLKNNIDVYRRLR